MPLIPIFGVGLQGKSAVVTSQQRLNVYLEVQKDGEKDRVAVYGAPGLVQFASVGSSPVRGWRVVGPLLYVVVGNAFYEVNSAGQSIIRGTLATSEGRVDMSDNGAQVAIVDGVAGYIYVISSFALGVITAAGFPDGATTIGFLDGYFIVEAPLTGRFFISGIYDGFAWAPLEFANAESNPDRLVRVFVDRGELHLLGEFTTEFWGNTGATDFPFSAVKGATKEWGLAAKWSLAKLAEGIIFLGKSRLGQVQVVRCVGYQISALQDQEFDAIINGYPDVANATGFSFLENGHEFYQINFPASQKSWRYDVSTMLWSEVQSGNSRHRAEMHVSYSGRTLVSDYENSTLYSVESTAYSDGGAPIVRQIQSKHFFSNLERLVIDKLEIQFESGVGLATGQGDDPKVMLQWSKDNGRTWSNELWRPLGRMGEYLQRAVWRRLGQGRDFVFRLRVTDPVPFILVAATINAQQQET